MLLVTHQWTLEVNISLRPPSWQCIVPGFKEQTVALWFFMFFLYNCQDSLNMYVVSDMFLCCGDFRNLFLYKLKKKSSL